MTTDYDIHVSLYHTPTVLSYSLSTLLLRMASLPPPYPLDGAFSTPTSHAASISEDSDEYGDRDDRDHVDTSAQSTSSKTTIATTSGISLNVASSDGLRERARSPYSSSGVSNSTTVPKKEAVTGIVGAPPLPSSQEAADTTTNSKGKQRAVEDAEPESQDIKPDVSNDNPFACHIWCVFRSLSYLSNYS